MEIQSHYAIVSDRLEHDKRSVAAFLTKIVEDIQEEHPAVRVMHIFSDGAASQFKNKFIWCFLSTTFKELFPSLRVQWHFFATIHGKGAVDGVGATVKRAVNADVLGRQAILVTDAASFVDSARKSCPNTKIKLIASTEITDFIEHHRLIDRWASTTPVSGTHIEPVSWGEVRHKIYSEAEQSGVHTFLLPEITSAESSGHQPSELQSAAAKNNWRSIKTGDCVLVQFKANKSFRQFVGLVNNRDQEAVEIRFLRRNDSAGFVYILPVMEDKAWVTPDQRMSAKKGLRADSTHFTLEGAPFLILGGSIHYFRVPRAYWRDRLLKLKACGLNTLTTYVPWNLHEPERGVFLFQEQLDMEAYIRLAGELGLWVILRPGPYICAECDLGGLPRCLFVFYLILISWLLQDKKMKVRTTYSGFTSAVNSYFDNLILRITPLQFKNGGPIIAVQVDNEYGSYAKDKQYLPFIKEALLSRGISELLLTSDNHKELKNGWVDGAFSVLQPNKPLMVMEFWPGWFDVWGGPHHVFAAQEMISTVRQLLDRGISINFYMFHGGTNFGFMNGANNDGTYRPQTTSYDFDAPLTESGDYTTKYHLLRNLLSTYNKKPLSEPPAVQSRRVYEPVVVSHYISLWETLQCAETHFRAEDPISMENLPANHSNGQSYGYTLYQTDIHSGGELNSRKHVHDRALSKRTLSLLVENCGRLNYGSAMDNQQKGLSGDITLEDVPLKKFSMYCLDMKTSFINRLQSQKWISVSQKPTYPAFFRGTLVVDQPTDTFLKLPNWSKGVVFVNGQNLGRHWSVGPQKALYLPGPWLRSGDNEVTHNLQLLLLSPDKNIACGACGVWKVTGARSRASLTRNVMAVIDKPEDQSAHVFTRNVMAFS
ncbi:Beta-galactosidase-1-like protein 2 [Anabarilius grahami]|uniref:Beta-galactosidase-1-like protein 2 n=1 Tax=Anabarilius grahami TaxID=495550 RepID=A0A3N0Z5H0_ANAGA|nr:Beta-galactosidase-1-like protein 2 [Anabarilius grahami]